MKVVRKPGLVHRLSALPKVLGWADKRVLGWSGTLFRCLALVLAFASCKDRNPDVKEYDRAALTANVGQNLILPAYAGLQVAVTSLDDAAEDFRHITDGVQLDFLQSRFFNAWIAWKACSAYEFGPAANVSLRTVLNTFPCDTVQIHNNFTAGTWDLSQAVNIDARGFPALDFLLHGLGADDAAILARYQSMADSAKLQAYLGAVITDISTQTAAVQSQWGSYATTFQGSLGTDVGSSTSFLVNELNRDLEIIKTASLGIPLGKQTFDQPLPEKVEGLYSGVSKSLMEAELLALQGIFNGQNGGQVDGYGLREALDAVEAEYHGGNLGDAIHAQFLSALAALAVLPEPLSEAVVSNRPPVEAAYTEIQKLVVLLKTDMASALSILITYADADGD